MMSPQNRERPSSLLFSSLLFSRRASLALLGCMLAFFLFSASAMAQTSQSIVKRVINLWVDGRYGSDLTPNGAPWLNPRCTGGGNGCIPTTECKPNDVLLTTGQVLLHAPWPFKTINQPGGALSYIPTLPFSGPAQWEHAIIHVLPGLYARSTAYGTAGTHNPDNGLQPNGEKFPIHLPPHVSIQGASALNTVFDVSSPTEVDVAGPAFEFGTAGATGQDSFIDSIAIFGGKTSEKFLGSAPPKAFAAIALSNQISSAPTISNCFLYGNGIGVLVDAKADGTGGVHDGTKLFNNTIAFNHVGLWNGDIAQSTGSSIGISKLILVNNIFDASPESTTYVSYPTNWAFYAPTAAVNNAGFEGVSLVDLQTGLTSPVDSNAYEAGLFNTGTPHPLVNLPFVTNPRTAGVFTPTHNILPYTRGNGVRRGILYVRDALTKPVFATDTGNSTNFDQSPHDFRLSPAAALANNTPQPPSALNPMVNAGWGGTFPMTQGNGLIVSNPPGYLSLGVTNQNTWAYHNWNWDCEGYGNPRFQNHGSFYPNNGVGIDIGADELGQLLAVGYRFGTTHFMDAAPSLTGVKVMDNKYLWFLGPPTGLNIGGSNTVPAPTNVSGPVFRAIDHIPLPLQPANYFVKGVPPSRPTYAPWFSSWSFSNSTNYYFPAIVDITPHLLDDFHPWWHQLVLVPTNPIWQSCNLSYNGFLYVDPSVGRINPTGSYKGDINQSGGNNLQWLDSTWTVTATPAFKLIQPFGVVVSFRTNTNGTLGRYDAWGRGHKTFSPTDTVDKFKPTYMGTNMVALRYCLENYKNPPFTSALTDTNLQSFLVLVKP